MRSTWTGIIVLVGAPLLVGLTLAMLAATGPDDDTGEVPTAPEDTTFTDAGALTVSTSQLTFVCDAWWMVPRSPDEMTFDDVGVDVVWPEHPAGEGGAPAAPHLVVATVQGTSDTEVVITGIVPHVRRRGEAPEGTVLSGGEQCGGGPGAFRWLTVDLDDPAAPLRPEFDPDVAGLAADDVPDAELVPIRFPYEVSRSDAESFLIEAHTETCDCEWWLDLQWQAAGEAGVVRIDDHGEPFRTLGTSRAFARCDSDGSCGPPDP